MKTHPFTPTQLETLYSLRAALPDVQRVLVGAAALGCHLEMRWRSTKDLDLSILSDPIVPQSLRRSITSASAPTPPSSELSGSS